MKKIVALPFFIIILFSTVKIAAQAIPPVRHKIAVFTPLYLDSVFDATGDYRYNKTFPKFLNPGLEFYQGAQLALDSLQKAGVPLEVFFYDSRSRQNPIAQQLNSPELQNVELIIGQANLSEARILSEAAKQKKVPFISATLPNDGGATNNPYLVILNSTLRTHCEGIYNYLQKYHPADPIVVFSKPGVQEDQLKAFFKDITQSTTAKRLNVQFVNINYSFTTESLTTKLDSTRKTVCIVGSLDETFGKELAKELASLNKSYPVSIIGMPTWDGLSFNGSDFKDVDIIYTTPFYYSTYNKLTSRITSVFTSRIKGRPTDMYYRGYEVMLRFAELLSNTGKDFASNLTQKGYTVFTPFDIEPVFLNKQNMTLDYFENKKLYFIRTLNGVRNILY